MSRIPVRIVLPTAVLLLAVGGCSSTAADKAATAPTTTVSTAPHSPSVTGPSSTPAPNSSPATAEVRITIANFAFSPAKLTVHPGTTVTVVNNDTTTHTLTASGGAFDTGPINPGKSATITVPATAGTYPYVCTIHASMLGTLTVG